MKKKEGFPGQQSYVIPDKLLKQICDSPYFKDLYLTDIGYYPQASHHYRERLKGIRQNILIYNVEGEGIINIKNKTMTVPPGHFFIIPEDIPHAYSAVEDNPWSIYWIHFSGPKAKYLAKPILTPTPVNTFANSRLTERFNLFSEIFHTLERGYNLEVLEYVNLCLPKLLASFSHIAQYTSMNDKYAKDPVNQTVSFMLDHITQKYKLEDFAKLIKISPSHLSRIFLNQTGHSPIEYFIQLKIQQSCRLLDNNSLTIYEVARQSGFEDQFYFSRQFRKVMNMSPSQYRKR